MVVMKPYNREVGGGNIINHTSKPSSSTTKANSRMGRLIQISRERWVLSFTGQIQNRQVKDPEELTQVPSPILATTEGIILTRQLYYHGDDVRRHKGPIGALATNRWRTEAPLPKTLQNRESWSTFHKLRCVDEGNSVEIATDESRAEKREGVDGNSSNKERNGWCVVSEAEQGAALDAVLMDVDPLQIPKGGNPNLCLDHKPPSELEIAKNMVKSPFPTLATMDDPQREIQANVYGVESGEQHPIDPRVAHFQGFMEVEPVSGYPIPGNDFSSLNSQSSLRRQKSWARKKRDIPKCCGQSPTKTKRKQDGKECAASMGKEKKTKLQEKTYSFVEVKKDHEGQSDTFPTAEVAR
ncbi:hypothetical protein U1Q18_032899 [Sarracenia purpurea var. burkii]